MRSLHVGVRLTQTESERLERLATETGMSVSGVIRHLVAGATVQTQTVKQKILTTKNPLTSSNLAERKVNGFDTTTTT